MRLNKMHFNTDCSIVIILMYHYDNSILIFSIWHMCINLENNNVQLFYLRAFYRLLLRLENKIEYQFKPEGFFVNFELSLENSPQARKLHRRYWLIEIKSSLFS